jgi:hypothetical protein
MITAQALWHLNNEYVQRLANARRAVSLLIALVETRLADPDPHALDGDPDLYALLHAIADALENFHNEHRQWRYSYFYAPEAQTVAVSAPMRPRMVQDEGDVRRAIAQFVRMRTAQLPHLAQITHALAAYPQPDPHTTSVATADLWHMMRGAIDEFSAEIV